MGPQTSGSGVSGALGMLARSLSTSRSPGPSPAASSRVGTLIVRTPTASSRLSRSSSTATCSSCWPPSISITTGGRPTGANRKSHRCSPAWFTAGDSAASTACGGPAASMRCPRENCGTSQRTAPGERSATHCTNRHSSSDSVNADSNDGTSPEGTASSAASSLRARFNRGAMSPGTACPEISLPRPASSRSEHSASGCKGGATPRDSSFLIPSTNPKVPLSPAGVRSWRSCRATQQFARSSTRRSGTDRSEPPTVA